MIDVGSLHIKLEGFAESEADDIRRCLNALYTVREGEQPMDRDFGLNNSFLDKPLNIAKNMFALEVIKKTKRYEKRVKVNKVEFHFDSDGQMTPTIYLERGGVS